MLPGRLTEDVFRRYVLWTDEDNLKLVQRYYPEFLETYMALPAEIYRADMVGLAVSIHHLCVSLKVVSLGPKHVHASVRRSLRRP
jgi:hypothetical protein